jgi:hypothetical protein
MTFERDIYVRSKYLSRDLNNSLYIGTKVKVEKNPKRNRPAKVTHFILKKVK